ncbi:MAG: prefoldin subunit alpha [Candidatus Thalassarchaeaceae archaeon]
MTTTDKAELQKIAQQVEISRERLQAMEQQISRLEEVKSEQNQALQSLEMIPLEGAKDIMVPLGSGVQILANIPKNTGAVIDIGSRVQAEKTREEAIMILQKRNDELNGIIDKLKSEFNVLEQYIVSLAHQFTTGVENIQESKEKTKQDDIQEDKEKIKTPRKRRKRGTELTLDD